LGFAKMLLTDTALSLEDITRISRFDNSQDMLDALSSLYQRDPLALRKPLPVQIQPGVKSCALMLSYRPPFDWSALLDYFRARAITNVENVAGEVYQRNYCLNEHQGWLSLQKVSNFNAARLEVHGSDLSCLMQVVWRVRRMLDLDADPLALGAFFSEDPLLGPVWLRHPGLRVPVGWDSFEFAVRAIVGQVVSVGVATKLMGNIVEAFAENLSLTAPKGIEKVFPSPALLQGADMRPCGLSRNKATAISALARGVVSGTLDLETAGDFDTFIQRCTALRGIGEWTAQTIAMRGLGDADAFPASDLGIVKALSAAGHPFKPADIRKMAERWRPWRSYAAMLLWMMRHD
jgi:AraC family transcriptional regulator, regulatory protein of adaptative response / DNA-3-methyladenine glycosylase II